MTAVDKKAQVQELYGAHARAYTTSTVHAQGASLERLVAQVAPKGHELVLDVATGVPVGEAAGQDDCLDVRKLVLGVPGEQGFGTHGFERERRVAVVLRSGEDDNGDPRPGLGHASCSSISIS